MRAEPAPAFAPDPIVEVTAEDRVVELPTPVRIGDMEIVERRYVVVTLATAQGHAGCAYALSRDLPLATIVSSLAEQHLLGRDGDAVGARRDGLVRATMSSGRAGAVMKAISLVDIALWDAKARRAGMPLWRLIGGANPECKALMVAAYPDSSRPVEELAEQVLAYARQGFSLVKIARDRDPDRMVRWLKAIARGLPSGTKLVVDGVWAFRRADEVLEELFTWPDIPVAWIEDPLVPEDTESYARLRRRSPFPIAAGDEVADSHVLRHLLEQEAVDVIRLDVSCLGVSGARDAAALAAAAGVPVSYHVYPEISIHLAAARPEGAIVESFDPQDNPYDPARMILVGGAAPGAGTISAPESPGLGFTIRSRC